MYVPSWLPYEKKDDDGNVIIPEAPVTPEVPKNYSTVGNPNDAVMRRGGLAKANDIEMVLLAFQKNESQRYVDYTYGDNEYKKSEAIRSY